MGPKHAGDTLTSLTLLASLRDDVRKHQAWYDFMDRYGPRVEGWCRRWGLQEADAHDVTQNVMLQLARQMETFEYDSRARFRSWLKTVAWRAWADFLSARNRNPALPGTADLLDRMDSVEARDDLMERLDDEANREILEVAIRRVRSRVQEKTFEAFRLMALEGLSGAKAAEQIGIKPGSAFVAKSRVDRMINEEIVLLDPDRQKSKK